MNVKLLRVCLTILGVMVISGCSAKPTFVDRVVKVPTLVKCEVSEPKFCNYGKSTYTEEIDEMRLCITELKAQVSKCKEE